MDKRNAAPAYTATVLLFLLWMQGALAQALLKEDPNQGQCQSILANKNSQSKDVNLKDLISEKVVAKMGPLVYASSGNIRPHEVRTAELLAARLDEQVALIPEFFNLSVPAVDGVLFSPLGEVISNFSLKTMNKEDVPDLNRKINSAISKAENSLARVYSIASWNKVVNSRLTLRYGQEYRDLVLAALVRIFGLSQTQNLSRPVSIVIDHSEMPYVNLRLYHDHMNLQGGGFHTRTFMSFDHSTKNLIEIDDLIRRVSTHPEIKEYIFLGTRHLLRVTDKGYSLNPFCSSLGVAN